MRIVLDTNIFISGLLIPTSDAGMLTKLWHLRKIELITSDYLLSEIQRVLAYPKIAKRINWHQKQIDDFIKSLSLFTTLVNTQNIEANVPKDQSDDKILATLLASKADYLVTGDDDLLSLRKQYSIITLGNIIKILKSTTIL